MIINDKNLQWDGFVKQSDQWFGLKKHAFIDVYRKLIVLTLYLGNLR